MDTAINLKAQLSAKGELIDAEESVLSIVIHGMDAAKLSSMEGWGNKGTVLAVACWVPIFPLFGRRIFRKLLPIGLQSRAPT